MAQEVSPARCGSRERRACSPASRAVTRAGGWAARPWGRVTCEGHTWFGSQTPLGQRSEVPQDSHTPCWSEGGGAALLRWSGKKAKSAQNAMSPGVSKNDLVHFRGGGH